MMLVQLFQASDPVLRVLVAQAPAKRIAGIGRLGDDTPVPQQIGHLGQQALLRVFGMNGNEFGHPSILPQCSTRLTFDMTQDQEESPDALRHLM